MKSQVVKQYILLLMILIININLQAQIGINNDLSTPHSSAMLDIKSNEKGILIPRMTTTERGQITNPATGLIVFDTSTSSFWFFNGSDWTNLVSDNLGNHTATQPLDLSGNDIMNAQVVFAETFFGDGGNLTNVPGDDLGNHTATQILNLATHNVINGGVVNANSFVGDGSGLTNIPGDNLGSHVASHNIQLGPYTISGDGDNEGLTVSSQGNVGINIGNSQTLLGIYDGVGTGPVGITQNKIAGNASMELTTEGLAGLQATRLSFQGNTADADVAFYTGASGSEATTLFIEGSNGNVGIGTNTPTATLHLKESGDGSTILNLETERQWSFQQEGTGSNSNLRLRNTSGLNKQLLIDTDGSTRFRIQNGSATSVLIDHLNGNVGIGTIAPKSRLDVGGGNISLSGGWISNDGDNEGIDIRNDGHVGIGRTATGGPQLYVSGDENASYGAIIEASSTAMAGALRVGGPQSIEVLQVLNSNFDDLLIVEGDGRVGVNRNPATNKLEVGGNASKTTAGFWLANSDRRIKTDIQTIDHALETLSRVRLVSFEYTDEYKNTHKEIEKGRYLNVIAQEFAEVFPDHVKGSGEFLPDGSEILQVDTYPLTIYSAAAIQEQQSQIEMLQQQLIKQESENALLKQHVSELMQLKTMIEQVLQSNASGSLEANKN